MAQQLLGWAQVGDLGVCGLVEVADELADLAGWLMLLVGDGVWVREVGGRTSLIDLFDGVFWPDEDWRNRDIC